MLALHIVYRCRMYKKLDTACVLQPTWFNHLPKNTAPQFSKLVEKKKNFLKVIYKVCTEKIKPMSSCSLMSALPCYIKSPCCYKQYMNCYRQETQLSKLLWTIKLCLSPSPLHLEQRRRTVVCVPSSRSASGPLSQDPLPGWLGWWGIHTLR